MVCAVKSLKGLRDITKPEPIVKSLSQIPSAWRFSRNYADGAACGCKSVSGACASVVNKTERSRASSIAATRFI